MIALQKMALLDLVANEIVTRLGTRTMVDIFFDLRGFRYNTGLRDDMEIGAYVHSMLKDIENDKLLAIAQNEFGMDTAQFTDVSVPRSNEMPILIKIDLMKTLLAEITKQMVSEDKIERFISHAATNKTYRGGDNEKPFHDFMLIQLRKTEVHELFRIAQHELDMDISQFTNSTVPKENGIKIVKKMELEDRVVAEIIEQLGSRKKINTFLREVGFFVDDSEGEQPLDKYVLSRIRGADDELCVRIAQHELQMDIRDLL